MRGLKIIAHRVNHWNVRNKHGVYGAEIDVQVMNDGTIKAVHDPNDWRPGSISEIFDYAGYYKFFVDIKQNLDVRFLRRIVDLFEDRLIGLFDVPWPSAYYARRAGLPIWERLSEYEPVRGKCKRFWLDPLRGWHSSKYERLLKQVPRGSKVIVCSPELHEESQSSELISCWGWIKDNVANGRIYGLVTKKPKSAMDFFEISAEY